MLERQVGFLRTYTTANAGKGPSSTKLVWLTAGLASVYCATLATVADVASYLCLGLSDNAFHLFVGALWVNALGFASGVQRAQHRAAKEIALGQQADEGRP